MRIFQFYLHIPFLCFLLYNKKTDSCLIGEKEVFQ